MSPPYTHNCNRSRNRFMRHRIQHSSRRWISIQRCCRSCISASCRLCRVPSRMQLPLGVLLLRVAPKLPPYSSPNQKPKLGCPCCWRIPLTIRQIYQAGDTLQLFVIFVVCIQQKKTKREKKFKHPWHTHITPTHRRLLCICILNVFPFPNPQNWPVFNWLFRIWVSVSRYFCSI